jgi:hypothetical protein
VPISGEDGKCAAISRPPPRARGQGTASAFYRPRGGGLQSCSTILDYMWWYGVQRRGVGGRPGKSCSWWDVAAILCLSRSSFEGSGVGASCLVVVRTPARGLG